MTLKRTSANGVSQLFAKLIFSNTGRNLTLFVTGFERKKKRPINNHKGIKLSPVPNRVKIGVGVILYNPVYTFDY